MSRLIIVAVLTILICASNGCGVLVVAPTDRPLMLVGDQTLKVAVEDPAGSGHFKYLGKRRVLDGSAIVQLYDWEPLP